MLLCNFVVTVLFYFCTYRLILEVTVLISESYRLQPKKLPSLAHFQNKSYRLQIENYFPSLEVNRGFH